MTIDTMTREAAAARMTEIHERITGLSEKQRLSKGDEQDLTELGAEFDELTRHVEKLDRCTAIAGAAGEGGGGFRIERGSQDYDPYAGRDAAQQRAFGGVRDSAMRTLEKAVKGGLAGRAAEVAERLIDNGDDMSRSWAARYFTDTGSPEYRSAFAKLLLHGEQSAALSWTAPERAAFERVVRLKSEQRAMSLTSSSGGYLVPFELDPSIAIINAGSTCPLLDISRVIKTVTDTWHGVSSAGVQASFDAEASEVSDDSPVLAEPSIPAYKAAAFVPFSIEVEGDAVSLLSEVGKLMTDGMTQLLNQKLTVGSGTGEPTGIVTALAAGSGVVVNTGTGGTLAASDIYGTQSSLGPRWQASARWIGTLNVYNTLRQDTSPNGSFVFPELRTVPPSLLSRPTHEASYMDSTIAAGKNLLIYGDWSNYVVTQRVGATVELIPHLFGANRRPTGQRGLYMWARYGADSINDSAFRMLQA
jgi:HK97 family phage major capsid protein